MLGSREYIPMSDGTGIMHRVHPILAVYVGDYPEQVLVTGIKMCNCPKCNVPFEELGNLQAPSHLWGINATLSALSKLDDNLWDFKAACKALHIKPIIHPFWELLPFINIFQAITPDILHQLLQGILKHLISWLIQAYGATKIDAHFWHLILNHHIQVFAGRISSLSHVTGKEHGLMGCIILGVIADMGLLHSLNPSCLLHAIRAFLDFMYIAWLPVITVHHLTSMKTALDTFHNNKQILVDLDICEQFNLPKLHACLHYIASIKLFGTTDNYDTQYMEWLHIDLAKRLAEQQTWRMSSRKWPLGLSDVKKLHVMRNTLTGTSKAPLINQHVLKSPKWQPINSLRWQNTWLSSRYLWISLCQNMAQYSSMVHLHSLSSFGEIHKQFMLAWSRTFWMPTFFLLM